MSNQSNHPEAIINFLVTAGDAHSEAVIGTDVTRAATGGGNVWLRNEVSLAALSIDASGAVAILADGCHVGGGFGARIQPDRIRLLLIGMQVLASMNRPMTIAGVHRLLVRLSIETQRGLGVVGATSVSSKAVRVDRGAVTLHQLYRVARVLNSRLAFTEAAAPNIDQEERARRQAVLHAYDDALMAVCRPWWSGSTSVSAIGVQAWACANLSALDESLVAAKPTRSHRRDVDAQWGCRGDRHTFHAYFGYRLVAEVQRQGSDW